jgi:hypothetical protein
MPTYTIQTPDRRTVRVQAPDAASAMRQVSASGVRGSPPVDPITGYLTTVERAVPFLTEAGAGFGAGLRSLDDMLSGQKPDFGQNWARARAEQQAVVDSFRRDHPFWSNNATALGTVAPMGLGGLGAGDAAQSAARLGSAAASDLGAAGGRAVAKKVALTAARNAFVGAGVGAVYGASRPGNLQQRTQYAADALAPGASWGAAVPLGLGAVAGGARSLAGSIGETATGAGAMGSELADTLSRAATGRTPVDQSRQISVASGAKGQADAVALLRRMGVTPEAIEDAQTAALGKPITTAEAMGPSGMALAQGLRGRAGTTDAMAGAFLRSRAESRPDRILDDTSQVTGVHPLAILGDLDQLLAESRQRGADYFQDARKLVSPNSKRLQELYNAPEARQRWQTVTDILKSSQAPKLLGRGYQVAEDGQMERRVVPALDFLDTLKDQLQGALEGQTGPLNEKQQAIREIADGLHASMTSAVPSGMAYDAAHNFRGDLSSTEAALRNAQGRLLSPSVSPSSFEDQFYTLKPFERDAATAAGAGDLANLAYNQPFDSSPISDPVIGQKLRLLFGQKGADSLAQSFGAEDAMARFEQPQASDLGQRLRAAAQTPLNMAGRNALGSLLYQDAGATAQAMRRYGDLPNAFDTTGIRLPPVLQYGWSGLSGMASAPGLPSSVSQP